MSGQPSSKAPLDFLAMACRLGLIDDPTARRLHDEALQSGVSGRNWRRATGCSKPQISESSRLSWTRTRQSWIRDCRPDRARRNGGRLRARQKSLDRIVALKMILFSQMHDPTALSRFEREAVAVAKLRHPNIVAAYDLGRSQRCLYFAMELIEGTDVEQFVKTHGPLDEAAAWGLVRQATSGLSHAASAGIIHRDVKPANLLLVDPPAGFELPGGLKMVKITDFGLAFLMRDVETTTRLTSANATIGSPHYIAAEQLEGDAFDHRVDIYSLGATAYHMLTGEPPFNGGKLSQIIAGKLTADSLDVRAKIPDISPASAELLQRMTFRDPARRIASYSELLAQIDGLQLPPGELHRSSPLRMWSSQLD